MIPLMVIDESDRIAKYRFYSSDKVLASEISDDACDGELPSFKPPKRDSLRRAVSVPTSFKERKRQHRRNKTSPVSTTKHRPLSALCNRVPPAQQSRKWQSRESRYTEQHDSNRWAFAHRDEYNRYLIPRTSSTEQFMATTEVKIRIPEDDGVVLRGLAFVDEGTD